MLKKDSNRESCGVAEELASMGRYEKAIKRFERVYNNDKTCARAALGIAECYASKLELSAMSLDSIMKLKDSPDPSIKGMVYSDREHFHNEKIRMFGAAMDHYMMTKYLVITHKDTSDLLSLRPRAVTECEEGMAYIKKIMEKCES
jgi:hypothetical protein